MLNTITKLKKIYFYDKLILISTYFLLPVFLISLRLNYVLRRNIETLKTLVETCFWTFNIA